ncbi:MAG: N-6 DNA methylase [Chloroflexota bacterium]|nr:N-6 DNA methylase [Chloroflexota bacterium]
MNPMKAEIAKARRSAASRVFDDSLATAMVTALTAAVSYWDELGKRSSGVASLPMRQPPACTNVVDVPAEALESAREIGRLAAGLDVTEASFAIGELYTGTMPKKRRAALGAFYTPPALCERLLDMATEAGVDWKTARVLDPACGGGAFLAPVARRMARSMENIDAAMVIENVENRLYGIELDPFAAWLSHIFLDATLYDLGILTDRGHRAHIQVGDALDLDHQWDEFDLVVGNPPYGRVKLSSQQRCRYRRSLYGHANLYGLFTDRALRFTRSGGTIALVTPTSFLAGAYFKALRGLLAQEAPPIKLEFIAERKGVFADVLQETALAVYRRGDQPGRGEVRFSSVTTDGAVETTLPRTFGLPENPQSPWLIPRTGDQTSLAHLAVRLKHRLSDYGYEVSTGPLVWNRHRSEIKNSPGKGRFPLIWAESVRAGGVFDFRAQRRDHQPYFQPRLGQEWLVTRDPCVLLQRTTAKEQSRRLVAAELPLDFLDKHEGVVVENHLNVIRPKTAPPRVSPGALAALLNSRVADQMFRCINGSVAVSAYELEALPLPPPDNVEGLAELVRQGSDTRLIEREVAHLYGETDR